MLYTNVAQIGKCPQAGRAAATTGAGIRLALGFFLVVAILSASVASGSDASGSGSIRLTAAILVNGPALAPHQIEILHHQVDRIWRPYGVDVEWDTGAGNATPHLTITIENELPLSAYGLRVSTVAWVGFVESNPSSVLHASVGAARRMLEHARLGERLVSDTPVALQDQVIAQILGRALAHEIGHCLLGTRHARAGLMRANIPPDDFPSDDISRFRLEAWQAAALRQRALSNH